MRRLLTILGLAVVAPGVPGSGPAARGAEVTATVYVGRHFEVRDHDQPVKYVFSGSTRVARVTGSLSERERRQWLRLREGWNLCGVGVDGGRLPTNAPIAAAYRWDPATQGHEAVAPGQPMGAGQIVWVRAHTNQMINVLGTQMETAPQTVPEGGAYVSGGLAPRDLPAGRGGLVWRFPGGRGPWSPTFNTEFAQPSGDSPPLAAGEAAYVRPSAGGSIELPAADPATGIVYYHPDHLGSASVVTDAAGRLVSETAYDPFGGIRHDTRWQPLATAYQFTQKERDRETGLQDFGHRFYHAGLSRWLSPDPLGERGGGLNPYAYVNQNPLRHIDPNGAQITVTPNHPKKPTHYEITVKAVFVNVSSTKFTAAQLQKFASDLRSTIEVNLQNTKGKVTWSTKVNLRVVEKMSDVEADDHVFRIIDKGKGAGEHKDGSRIMSITSHRYTQIHPSQVDPTDPKYRNYTLENFISAEGTGMHEFGHAAGLPHDRDVHNIMAPGDLRKCDQKLVRQDQVEMIWRAYKAGELNRPDPDLEHLRKSR